MSYIICQMIMRDDRNHFQKIERIQSFVSSFSDIPHSIKDNNSKRVDTFLETFTKEEQQSRTSSLPSFNQKPVSLVTMINPRPAPEKITNSISSEQHAPRTVTFDNNQIPSQSISNRLIRTSSENLRLSNHHSIPDNHKEKESVDIPQLSVAVVNSGQMNLTTQDLNNLISEEEYIPGGFANLDHELEQELLHDFIDEFDHQIIRRHRAISSVDSSDHLITITRSPIELWQRARILIAVHLYQIQIKSLHLHDNTFATPVVIDPSMMKTTDNQTLSNDMSELDYLQKLFQQKENIEERKIIFGLSILQKYSLDPSQQYQCVDFYDVGQGYIIMCSVLNSNHSKDQSPLDQNSSTENKLLVYPINKNLSNKIHSVEFDCPFQFHFMVCIPIFRIILGFVNIKPQKSLLVLIGDASRKGIFLSKQEIYNHIYSILYLHETAMLFIGCMGRVLLYNTQPLQYSSQPLFTSELSSLPFQSMEPIIHLCQIRNHRSIGILSTRYFVLWEYTPKQHLLMKFCNPYRYDFVRCHYNSKYDYIIFAFLDGFILIYQFHQMKQIRRYQYHWNIITDLKTSQDNHFLLSSSIDHMINIWNLKTLQHLYQYNTQEEIFQMDILQENLFHYRTLRNLILFKLNLQTLLFSITKSKVLSLKLFIDTQKTARLIALLEDYSGILISPVSGCCLTHIPNIAKKPIKQILHDISRSTIYSLYFDGEIILYHAHNNPCVAQYKIRTKSPITCMTSINPMHTHLLNINTMKTSQEKSLEKQMIFFGHANGYISLFQGETFLMEPILAHENCLVCLETSRASMEKSNILFTNCEMLLSSNIDGVIYLWDLIINKRNESIELIHLVTITQEKNISSQSMKYLSMIDNFIVANYSDQKFLHIWQLLNISIQIHDHDQWGIVEHPTKGKAHHGQIQAISATSKLKLFASSDTEGWIKIWDNTNSLLREIYLDQTLGAIEFLSTTGELLLAYQNNIHFIFPENYFLNSKKCPAKQSMIIETIAEENRLEVMQPVQIPYQSLPIFHYNIKTHHLKKRLQRFEQQLAGRYAVIESDTSQSDPDESLSATPDRLSIMSDDSNWSNLAEDVKDILRMKKDALRQEKKLLENIDKRKPIKT